MKKRIFITGGHLSPASAVMDKLDNNIWEIFYIGRKTSLEGEKTTSAEFNTLNGLDNLKFLAITTGRLQRHLSVHTIPSLLKIPFGFFQSLNWLNKFHPDIVLSFGGYVGVPVALAAALLHIPVVIHEQTLVPSLSSQLISPFAKRILVSFPQMLIHYQKEKVVLTGNPIRKEIFKINQTAEYKNFLDRKNKTKLPVLYITGGSQGAHSINQIVLAALPELLKNHLIIHQCGSSEKFHDYENLEKFIKLIPQNEQNNYFLKTYVDSKSIGWVLKVADIVISRSGANTVSEIAACQKVAVLIPLPWSGNGEQQKNAAMLENLLGAKVIPQEFLTSKVLINEISEIEANMKLFRENAQKSKKLIDLTAAQNIVSEVEKMIC